MVEDDKLFWSKDKNEDQKPLRKKSESYAKVKQATSQRNNQNSDIVSILMEFCNRLNITESLKEKSVYVDWEKVVGAEISAVSKVKSVKDGVMQVRIKDAVWRQELNYLENDIISKINKYYNKQIITKIKFV